MEKCKNVVDKCEREATEASGFCFDCAEELACLLDAEGLDTSSAWE